MLILLLLLVPLFVWSTETERGIASWYTAPLGTLTANGEGFDPTLLAAAHKELKFGTIVGVFNEESGKSVEVRIFDRGPFVEGRIIDLTPAAAEAIDLLEAGIAPVTLTILSVPRYPESHYNRPGDSGYYRLQVGSFTNQERITEHVKTLSDAGYQVETEKLGDLTRLSVRWIDESKLEETLGTLQGLGFIHILKLDEERETE